MIPIIVPGAKRKRGDPHWGQSLMQARVLSTEFEMQVKRMGLTQAQLCASVELKRWCALNRNRVYIPEWLLDAWRMSVNVTPSNVA